MQAAVRLRPEAGEAHLARAELLYRGYLDYDGALAELAIARQTLPNEPSVSELAGYIARRRGNQEDGLHHLERALQLDPRNFFTLQQVALSYYGLRRYREAAAALDQALEIIPDDVETQATRALLELDSRADPRPLHRVIDSIRAKGAAQIERVADVWLICALGERDIRAAEAALSALGDNTFGNDAMQFHYAFVQGLIARMANDQAKARAAFTAA